MYQDEMNTDAAAAAIVANTAKAIIKTRPAAEAAPAAASMSISSWFHPGDNLVHAGFNLELASL